MSEMKTIPLTKIFTCILSQRIAPQDPQFGGTISHSVVLLRLSYVECSLPGRPCLVRKAAVCLSCYFSPAAAS